MRTRMLGKDGLTVSAMGLGCMGMSEFYGPRDDAESLATLERAFERRLATFEFLGADEPWKLEWTSQVRERVVCQAFAPSPAGVAAWAAYAYGRPLAKRVAALRRRAGAGARA